MPRKKKNKVERDIARLSREISTPEFALKIEIGVLERQRRIVLAVASGYAWHPDVTAMELERHGADLEVIVAARKKSSIANDCETSSGPLATAKIRRIK